MDPRDPNLTLQQGLLEAVNQKGIKYENKRKLYFKKLLDNYCIWRYFHYFWRADSIRKNKCDFFYYSYVFFYFNVIGSTDIRHKEARLKIGPVAKF
ncbi:hypothetical protein D5366_06515 [Neokomagataea tanensis]|uniref:Uncharacterized protein n=1 Tax=Neokomagataea tanensis TaxID=661191 RepID=A0A4Y6V8G4_9PROT|nr:hypothetical protein D5366_06515 [Neokomagataea tanensis]